MTDIFLSLPGEEANNKRVPGTLHPDGRQNLYADLPATSFSWLFLEVAGSLLHRGWAEISFNPSFGKTAPLLNLLFRLWDFLIP